MIYITVTTEYIKLDQFLKFSGACETGGKAKTAIQKGLVQVNKEICTINGKKLFNNDVITVDGQDYCCVIKNNAN